MPKKIVVEPQFLSLDGLLRFLRDIGVDIADKAEGTKPWQISPNIFREDTTAEITRRIEIPTDVMIAGYFGSAPDRPQETNIVKQGALDSAAAAAKYDGIMWLTGFCHLNSLPTWFAQELKAINPDIPIIGANTYDKKHSPEKIKGYQGVRAVHDIIIYTNFFNFRQRDGIGTNLSNGGISIKGASGTNDELAGLYDCGKTAANLLGYGGVSESQGAVTQAINNEGKYHFVSLNDFDADKLMAKFLAQLEVDRYLRQLYEQSRPGITVVDVYDHLSSRHEEVHPIINAWKIKRRPEEADWRYDRDRHLPFAWYDKSDRLDLEAKAKLLLRGSREAVVGLLEDTLHQRVYRANPRTGEVGVFLFPTDRREQENITVALHELARSPTAFYSDFKLHVA